MIPYSDTGYAIAESALAPGGAGATLHFVAPLSGIYDAAIDGGGATGAYELAIATGEASPVRSSLMPAFLAAGVDGAALPETIAWSSDAWQMTADRSAPFGDGAGKELAPKISDVFAAETADLSALLPHQDPVAMADPCSSDLQPIS